MIYANTSPSRLTLFILLVLILAVGILLAFSTKSMVPADYFSLNGLTQLAFLRSSVFTNKLSFAVSSGDSSLLASVYKAFIPGSGDSGLFGSGSAVDVPVLLYHGITYKTDRFSMSPPTFKDQMFALKRAGYHTITLEEFKDFLKGAKKLDNKSFLLTFDDGRRDSYTGADPVLEAVGFNAVMFIATYDSLHTEDVAGEYYLHAPELRLMLSSGRWEVGSHALQQDFSPGGMIPIGPDGQEGNFLSNKMWLAQKGRLETDDEYKARVEYELTVSKKDIKDILGVDTDVFAFPFSDYGQDTINYPAAESVISPVIEDNYSVAFRQSGPHDAGYTSNYPGEDPYRAKRFETPTDWTGAKLVSAIENIQEKSMPYSDDMKSAGSWKGIWGFFGLSSGGLDIHAASSTTGSFVFLDGSGGWKDYLFDATVDPKGDGYVSMIARYRDKDNFVSCAFGADRVIIIEKKDGAFINLGSDTNPVVLPGKGSSLGISVIGDTVKCYEGREVALHYSGLDPVLSKGGVGIQVWNSDAGIAAATVQSASVVAPDQTKARIAALPSYKIATRQEEIANASPGPSSDPVDKTVVETAKTGQSQAKPATVQHLDPEDIQSWKADPGKLDFIGGGGMRVSANPTEKGALVYMPDGYNMKDYAFTVDISAAYGSKVSVLSRYADSKNYVVCEYEDRGGIINMVEVRDGKRYLMTFGSTEVPSRTSNEAYGSVGVRVQGETFECLRRGEAVAVATISTAPEIGTLGLKIQASAPSFASLAVDNLSLQHNGI